MAILPYPVRLRGDVVGIAARRWRATAAFALLAALACALPAWTVLGIAREERAWARATPVEARVRIASSRWGPLEVHRASALVGHGPDERRVVLGTLSVPSGVDTAADEVRRDPETGAVMLEAFVLAAPLRRALAIGALVVLLAGSLALGALSWRRRGDLHAMLAVASAPRERVVRCETRVGAARFAFEFEEPSASSYREAAHRRRRIEVRLRDDEAPPLLLGGEHPHLVLVTTERGEGPIVLRADLSPFALDPNEERAAREALARLTATLPPA
jgi:hypothetical protein